jgi:ABC-2 type transport system ATP-binding protein
MDCLSNLRGIKTRIGYMPENEAFIADMTAVRFLRIMGEISGLPKRVALEKAHEVLFHVGLGEARYRKLGTYSMGMKQMAKLAQSIVHGPELLILDEPTNGLDPSARIRMLKLIREMKEEHSMNIVLCSHLLRDVEEVCDEVFILNEGELVHQANLEEERRTNRRFIELEIYGDDSKLADKLKEQGAEGVSEGNGRWRIVFPPGMELDILWQMVDSQNLAVHHLTHRRDSLEEIFLKAVGHLEPPDKPDDRLEVKEPAHGSL